MFTDDRSEFGPDVALQLPACDLVNLHWIGEFLDYPSFFPAVDKPMVWTLHDMNPFTGGCHYDSGCQRFRDACGACPQLGSSRPHDLSFDIHRRKAEAYASVPSGRMHVVAPSRWLQKQAQASALFADVPVSVIPNGLDTHVFEPRDAEGLRAALGIPGSASVLLFVSDRVGNTRKGFVLLQEAIRGIDPARSVYLVSIGRGQSDDGLDNHIHLGDVSNDRLMSLVYSMADLFVIPSLEDNLPNTVLESLACGTPVVGFDIGGIPDMVRPGETGQLVKARDVAGMREAILQLLQDRPALASMGKQCRAVALAEYDLLLQAERYAKLYASMIGGGRP